MEKKFETDLENSKVLNNLFEKKDVKNIQILIFDCILKF